MRAGDSLGATHGALALRVVSGVVYEYRAAGCDVDNGVRYVTYSDSCGTLKEARVARREFAEDAIAYDETWIERRVIPEWERLP